MKTKVFLALSAGTLALAAVVALFQSRPQQVNLDPTPDEVVQTPDPTDIQLASRSPRTTVAPPTLPLPSRSRAASTAPEPAGLTNKLERLALIRETFRGLAAGDPTAALRAAKQITDGTERETALLTLATEWTHGELRLPQERAQAIALHGLEAGLGMELAKNPDLALLWANELTDGPGRAALIQQTAIALTASDPAAAFALSEHVPESERGKFFDAVFAGWAESDTGAALEVADQLADPAEKDAALRAIRNVAPVGIGAALRIQDGYPVINQVLPGTPAEASGQLHPGDRIVGLAQGDSAFVDAHGVALKDIVDMIRGTPGSVLQLQVVRADALPGSQPQILAITRDQIKYKR
jgi:PDZ domain